MRHIVFDVFEVFLIVVITALLILISGNILAEPTPFLQTMEPYKPIYLLNSWFLNGEGEEQGYDDRELLFQFSFKKQVYHVLYLGITYKALWQIYDLSNSRPFREQNYNPEGFLEFTDTWHLDILRLGLIEHESNGERQRYDENGPINYSRTWDRSYIYFWKNLTDYFGLGLKAWVVTSGRTREFKAYYNDNADLQYYMGSGELYASIGYYPTVLTVMLRRGWMEGTETYKVEGRLPLYRLLGTEDYGYDLYFLGFSGYGDSLIDYNRKITRIALGISVR